MRKYITLILAVGLLASCDDKKKEPAPTSTAKATSSATATSSAKRAPKKDYKTGDKVEFDDATWVVVSAKDAGKELPEGEGWKKGMIGTAKTDGRFILVKVKVTNKGKAEAPKLDFSHPKIVDDQSREFGRYKNDWERFPPDSKMLEKDAIPVGMTREFPMAFEVPADAKGLKLKVMSLQAPGKNTELVALNL